MSVRSEMTITLHLLIYLVFGYIFFPTLKLINVGRSNIYNRKLKRIGNVISVGIGVVNVLI